MCLMLDMFSCPVNLLTLWLARCRLTFLTRIMMEITAQRVLFGGCNTDLKINMEYISGNAFTYTQTLKTKKWIYCNIYQKCFFVVYVQYLHSIHYHVFYIL